MPSDVSRPPARFLQACVDQLPPGKALDIAAGTGRNALFLASHGWQVHSIDCDAEALTTLHTAATECGLHSVTTEVIDLEADSQHPPNFPSEQYDVVLVFFYLFRPLFPSVLRALKPGGMLVYETFLLENYVRYQRPKQPEFCLKPNELLDLTHELRVVHYEEGERAGTDSVGRRPGRTAWTARLLARKERE